MSQEQLSALLLKIGRDPDLRQKIQAAQGLDAAVEIAREIGFDVCAEDWLQYAGSEMCFELRDEELEDVAGGKNNNCSQQGPQCECRHGYYAHGSQYHCEACVTW